MIRPEFTDRDKLKLEIAAGIANSHFPYLGGIFAKLDVRIDDRIETAAVTESGKLLFNRGFFDRLVPGMETAFVVAHELLHLAQMVFERSKKFPDGEAVNIAHDVLINELICAETKLREPPRGMLSWQWFKEQCSIAADGGAAIPKLAAKASVYSLEEMVRFTIAARKAGRMTDCRSCRNGFCGSGGSFSNNPFDDFFSERASRPLDMIPEEIEKELFPDEDSEARRKAREELRKACRDAAVRDALLSSMAGGKGRGDGAGNAEAAVDIVRSLYAPPWQMAMQRWFDGVAFPRRSYARASRRGAWRSDLVLPGRDQDRFILHVVLDTSGSMADVHPILLGKIAAFARNARMDQVHILQCDAVVTADDFVDIENLTKYRIEGYGGSDMSPAMLKLAEDPEVTSVMVVTDGAIRCPPAQRIPYDVLWCLPQGAEWDADNLYYGKHVFVPLYD